jgi:CheY-like chemotaxis protein
VSDTQPPGPFRLLIVDDHEVVRQGLVALLSRRESFQVVAEAGSVAEAVEQALRSPTAPASRPAARFGPSCLTRGS